MKKYMIKIAMVFCVIIVTLFLFTNDSKAQHWELIGNPFGGPFGLFPDYGNNLIGSNAPANSMPIHFMTNGNTNRMMINEDFGLPGSPNPPTYLLPSGTASGWATAPNGYVGLGIDNTSVLFPGGTSFPWTRLHIHNPVSNMAPFGSESFGWRPWMQTGTYCSESTDHGYFGLKDNNGIDGDGNDRVDCIINWGDNDESQAPNYGPDNLRFIFTKTVGHGPTHNNSTNPLDAGTLSGREIARMTPKGYMGIGATFNNPAPPWSLLHLHEADTVNNVYLQISNWRTGQTENKGMKLGLNVNSITGQQNLAQLINQEDAPIAFYTNSPTTQTPNVVPPLERMRIFKETSPTINNRISRVAINENGSIPIVNNLHAGFTDIRSLLHLGYNTSAVGDGWRPWMDIGTFTCAGPYYGTGNMYVGLQEMSPFGSSTSPTEQQDAVINWGQTRLDFPNNVLRFVFTQGPGISKSNHTNGLEIARMTTADNNNGRMGIGGDPTSVANLYNTICGPSVDPTNTLEVNSPALNDQTPGGSSGLRFTDLTLNSPTLPNFGKVLSVDNCGDVILVNDNGGGAGIGYCNAGGLTPLTDDGGYDLYDAVTWHNFYFKGNGSGQTIDASVIIGKGCGYIPQAKLDVFQASTASNTIGINVLNTDLSDGNNPVIGINSTVPGTIPQQEGWQVAGRFSALGDKYNVGVDALANGVAPGFSFIYNEAGQFRAIDGNQNWGVYALASSSYVGGSSNIAVYGDLGPGCYPCTNGGVGPDWGGYFNGDIGTTMSWWAPSDSTLKHNIQNLTSPMAVLNQLHPKSYEFNQQQNLSMQLPKGTHFGVLAQELANVLPQLTKHVVHPARYDSLRNMTYDSIPYQAVNTMELIPYLIAAAKQHDSTIIQQNSTIQSLINQNNLMQHNLDSLWNALNNCCNITQNIAPNGNNGGGSSEKKLGNGNIHSIELSSASGNPILYQNIPNPFNNDGGTKIRYFVPDNMNSPMIVFFDEFGSRLQTFAITETGMGELDVTASNLVSGIYSYSLIINGKAVDTKKMVFQK